MKIGYVRVSTVEQNEARQVEALQKHDIERGTLRRSAAKIWIAQAAGRCSTLRVRAIPCMCSTGRVSAAALTDLLELVDQGSAANVAST